MTHAMVLDSFTLVLPLLVCFAGIVAVYFIYRMFNDD